MIRSRAFVFRGGPDPFALQSFDVPTLGPDETLVRIEACTLCGSDVHSVEGRRKVATPTILGHEIVGRIVAWGDRVAATDSAGEELVAGDRIVWGVVAACGDCFFCRRDLPQKCSDAVKYGHEAITNEYALSGGLAEYCVLKKGTAIVKMPETIPLAVACPASCATATVASAMEAAGDLRERNVLILGAGMLGLTACAMARSSGAAAVTCVELDEKRRSRSIDFGATHTSAPESLLPLAATVTNGHGFDAAIELSGANACFEIAYEAVRTGGTIVLAGAVFPNPAVSLELEQIVRRNLTLHGVHNYRPSHLVDAVNFLDEYHTVYPFSDLVSRWMPLEECAEAFVSAHDKRHIRVGVTP